MTDSVLFGPLQAGELHSANRVWMAPLTRSRAKMPGNIPWELNAEYYAQRANPKTGAGLIISEATPISPRAHGYYATPGIHTPEQVEGWKRVTDAVHKEGGLIVCQLWHVGRMSSSRLQPNNEPPVSSSAISSGRSTYVDASYERVACDTPRALETDEIPGVIGEYVHAAKLAKEAGFDGVEIHGANGYLLEQFLRSGINHRTDAYGGSLENRMRICLEVTDAVCGVWGAGRVGYRISPIFGDVTADRGEPDMPGTYGALCDELGKRGLAFLHAVEQFRQDDPEPGLEEIIARCRDGFKNHHPAGSKAVYVANGAYDAKRATARIETGAADAVAFGRTFISNPDLTQRFRTGAPLNQWDESTFYGGGAEGYTDYPVHTH